MNHLQSAEQVLQRELLPVRAKILEIAASLDRVQRAEGSTPAGTELDTIRMAINTLLDDQPGRAERVQILFSREYEANWREGFGI